MSPYLKCAIFLIAFGCSVLSFAAEKYVVVASASTASDPAWVPVIEALQTKHHCDLLTYPKVPAEVKAQLVERFPERVCFVMPHAEATKQRVAEIHRLTRALDDDPYTDVLWGILTGFDAANALRIAKEDKPLVIRKAAGGTELAMEMVEEGRWYCELTPHKAVFKNKGGEAETRQVPTDTTRALADCLNDYQADLFVTSGHATERDWQIGFRYRNGSFRCDPGQLYGLDTHGERIPIHSETPKVYMPIGNCLMGNIDSENAMALAWMNSAGVCQMLGYTFPTWYGYMGWGVLDYFVEQPGRYSFAEAFYANQQALLYRLNTAFPELADQNPEVGKTMNPSQLSEAAQAMKLTRQDGAGLLFDRDTVAFYGDPGWDARMAPQPLNFDQTLTREGDIYTFEIKPLLCAASFDPVNTNGAQRGYRPFFALLPERIAAAEILEGENWHPVITDNFILFPHPGSCDPERTYRIRFKAPTL